MPTPNVRNRARVEGRFGATGTGKSHDIKRALAVERSAYVIVFDPGHEYDQGAIYEDELAFLRDAGRYAGVRILRPSFDADIRTRQFDRFCRAGLAVARARRQCLCVIDELHLVTEAGRSPPGWRELIETGRKFGISVIAASIRPAAIDKSFWTNCTAVRTGRLNYADDQKTLANCLGVRPEEIAALAGHQFIARDLLTGQVTRG